MYALRMCLNTAAMRASSTVDITTASYCGSRNSAGYSRHGISMLVKSGLETEDVRQLAAGSLWWQFIDGVLLQRDAVFSASSVDVRSLTTVCLGRDGADTWLDEVDWWLDSSSAAVHVCTDARLTSDISDDAHVINEPCCCSCSTSSRSCVSKLCISTLFVAVLSVSLAHDLMLFISPTCYESIHCTFEWKPDINSIRN